MALYHSQKRCHMINTYNNTIRLDGRLAGRYVMKWDFNPFYTGNPHKSLGANSEDPDEIPQNAAFHLGQHCLLRKKHSSGTEYIII